MRHYKNGSNKLPGVRVSEFWRFDNLEKITGGEWLVEPESYEDAANGLTHDTRTLSPGQVYLAVKGEQFDGHRFVGSGLEAGAAVAIVSDEAAVGPGPVLLVDDTVAALQELASAFRDALATGGCKVIAVCGSNGKTTTRHLIHHVLTGCGLVGTQSPRSFNNHLGVPLTLLAADPKHDFVACEIGTNHPGEIASLGDIAWPDAAVITSIGREHLEFFKDLEGVAKEEAAILPFVRSNGLVVTPADAAEMLMPYYDVRDGVVFMSVRDSVSVPREFPLLGEHNRMNAALVVALSRWLGLDQPAVSHALADIEPPAGRLKVLRFGGGVTVLDDSYNANADSMLAALDCLGQQSGRRVAVLGEMLELGVTSADAHREVAAYAERAADHTIKLGPGFSAEPWSEKTASQIVDQLQPGDTVLLKASRGVGLERIIPAIAQRFGEV